MARAVIIIGLPYSNIKSPEIIEMMAYHNNSSNKSSLDGEINISG